MRFIPAAATTLALLAAAQAQAHAFLQTALPAVGSTIAVPPAEVTLFYTEAVEPLFSTITVQDAAGLRVDTGRAHLGADARHLAIGVAKLPPGTYKVTWRVTSVDTHKTQGSFSFTVTK